MRPSSFADRFAAELAAFRAAIRGPKNAAQAAAPLLLHRLMFVHFLRQGGFLDGTLDHLTAGTNGSLYRQLLLPLFDNTLADMGVNLFGHRPALAALDIADAAFRRLFAFFADYHWQLSTANGTGQRVDGVTPEILGTLFERHVNRKATGTYYTPDDVTAYIARTTIVPGLLERVRAECPGAFVPGGTVWQRLQADPDRYIFPAVRSTQSLPTETAAECAARRQHYRRLRGQLRAGRISTVNDLVTLNLDLQRLAQDLACDPRLQPAFVQALESHAVLDPTCGSGAFLFAALRVLEQLGSACGASAGFDLRQQILLRNLHGVDLMEDAVELCRLRLLLELLAVAQPKRSTRLPDLSTTIRAGDTLGGFDWCADFPGPMQRTGFDSVIGNPPYLPARQRRSTATRDFATTSCPDIYAWVLERSAALVRPGGRCGMIVPLSLAFSEDFAACRRLLLEQYGANWFAHFARIPSALFAGDVRVRNTIHLAEKVSGTVCAASDCSRTVPTTAETVRDTLSAHTTRLHRWFEAARLCLFEDLAYVPFRPEPWELRLPKLGSAKLLAALQARLEATSARLADCFASRPTRYPLHFKKTAYNWLTFCRRQPPCYDARGNGIPHTQFDVVYFPDARLRDLALLFLNGKWAFAFWCAVGDDFHVARWTFAGFPIDLLHLPARAVRRLRPLAGKLECAMRTATAFKQNAGKRVGTYNLARCREITDRSDAIFADCLGLQALWPEVELLYAQQVKTDFSGQESGIQSSRIVDS
jgi:hypothetical protein